MNNMKKDGMVITVLEAHVGDEKWGELEKIYSSSAGQLPPQMVRTWLLQDSSDPARWLAVSMWKSRKALEQYRSSIQTPGGVLIFRSVGAEPKLSIFEVKAELRPEDQIS